MPTSWCREARLRLCSGSCNRYTKADLVKERRHATTMDATFHTTALETPSAIKRNAGSAPSLSSTSHEPPSNFKMEEVGTTKHAFSAFPLQTQNDEGLQAHMLLVNVLSVCIMHIKLACRQEETVWPRESNEFQIGSAKDGMRCFANSVTSVPGIEELANGTCLPFAVPPDANGGVLGTRTFADHQVRSTQTAIRRKVEGVSDRKPPSTTKRSRSRAREFRKRTTRTRFTRMSDGQ